MIRPKASQPIGERLSQQMKINSHDFRVSPGKKVKLGDWPTTVQPFCKSKDEYKNLLDKHVDDLSSMQRLHYAANRYALLLIFQGIDAAGKDGAIRHVMSGVNPQGCQVSSFNQPSAEELNTIFFGAPLVNFRVEGRSESSIAPIMRKCSSLRSTQRRYAPKVYPRSSATRKLSGMSVTSP